MRDPKRLDAFYDELKRIHKTYYSDWRFGQLYYNFYTWLGSKNIDIFFPEEDKLIEYLKEYARYGYGGHKVYTVLSCPEGHIHGVFTTQEEAEVFVERAEKDSGILMLIQERIVHTDADTKEHEN